MKLAGIDYGALSQTVAPNIPSSIGGVITKVLDYVFPLAGIIMLFYLISSGYTYMMSQGDPKAMQAAKQSMTYAIIGFVVMSASFLIMKALGVTLNIQQIKDIFG